MLNQAQGGIDDDKSCNCTWQIDATLLIYLIIYDYSTPSDPEQSHFLQLVIFLGLFKCVVTFTCLFTLHRVFYILEAIN